MAISKIKTVTGNGTYESKYGLLYKFEYEFEDGVILTANHKTATTFFKPGTMAEYEISGEKNGFRWGKVKHASTMPDQVGGNFRRNNDDYTKGIEVGHAINNGVQMAIAIKGSKLTIADIEGYARDIMNLSERMKGEGAQPVKQDMPKIDEEKADEETNALPF